MNGWSLAFNSASSSSRSSDHVDGGEITTIGATELARRVRARDLSPVEVLQAHRERAEALNPTLNAIVTPILTAEDRAREAERAVLRGDELGPLHGVPFTIKDSLDTAGIRTTRGSRLFADHVPAEDATVVTRMLDAGAIPLGKTNVPEFVLWWETDNLVFGLTSNPWNLDRTAGGSSGGEAAAIASGLSPLGIGSDLGGSIRLPAYYCGIVGFKPTHGLVPLTGHWPDTAQRFMHVGPLARSVEDAALALSVVAGPDGRDWHCVPSPRPAVPMQPGSLEGLRVAVDTKSFGPADAEVLATVKRAGVALSDLGAVVEPVGIPELEAHDWDILTIVLFGTETSLYFADVIGPRVDDLYPALRKRLVDRVTPTLEGYVAAENAVEALRRGLTDLFRRYDLLLCPSGLVPAHQHRASEVVIDGKARPPRASMRATIPFDVTGSPALAVPFSFSEDGLPIGVQLVGPRFEDERVLASGRALEAVGEVAGRRPAL